MGHEVSVGEPPLFFDTNVLVYRADPRDPIKRQRAQELFDGAMAEDRAVISTQSLQEFYNAVTRKLGTPPDVARRLAQDYAEARVVQLTPPLIFSAMTRHAGGSFSFWDALVVEAARYAGCAILYTEDMQDGLQVAGLTIRNPFTDAPHA